MKATIRMFAVAKELSGSGAIDIELSAGATVADLRSAVVKRLPRLAQFGSTLRFAVNAEYVADETKISPTDDIACIPPVSGG